jgi:hypothetical protein
MALLERRHKPARGGFSRCGVHHDVRNEAAIGSHPVDELQEQLAQPLQRRPLHVDGDPHLRHEWRVPAFEQFGHEGFARTEVVDEAAEVYPCTRRHPTHRHGTQAGAARDRKAFLQQPFPAGNDLCHRQLAG